MTTSRFGSIGLSASVLAIVGVLACTQVGETQVKTDHMEHRAAFQTCAKACSDCLRQCGSLGTGARSTEPQAQETQQNQTAQQNHSSLEWLVGVP